MFKALVLALALLFATPAWAGPVEIATLNLLTGADSDVTTTNMAASVALSSALSGGYITKVCITFTNGVLAAQDVDVYFFDTNPSISTAAATLTVAQAQTVVARFVFTTEDFQTQFATASVACKDSLEVPFHTISHVVLHNTDANTLTNEAWDLHFWVK